MKLRLTRRRELAACGQPITTSHGRHEDLALELATTPTLLGGIRARLERQRIDSPLFDVIRHARHLERAYCVTSAVGTASHPKPSTAVA